MRTIIRLASAVTILTAVLAGTAHAQNDTVYLVTYVELMPDAVASNVAALKQYRSESRKTSGNHSNHFTVVEERADMKAADAHAMAAHTRAFREKLIPIKGALYDERFFTALN